METTKMEIKRYMEEVLEETVGNLMELQTLYKRIEEKLREDEKNYHFMTFSQRIEELDEELERMLKIVESTELSEVAKVGDYFVEYDEDEDRIHFQPAGEESKYTLEVGTLLEYKKRLNDLEYSGGGIYSVDDVKIKADYYETVSRVFSVSADILNRVAMIYGLD